MVESFVPSPLLRELPALSTMYVEYVEMWVLAYFNLKKPWVLQRMSSEPSCDDREPGDKPLTSEPRKNWEPPPQYYLLSHQVKLTPFCSSQLTVSISPRGTDAVLTAWPGHRRGCMSAARSVAQKVDSWFCLVESDMFLFLYMDLLYSTSYSGWIWFIRNGIWSTSLQGIETGNTTFVQTSDDKLKSQGWIPHSVSLVGESTVSSCPHQKKLFWESFTPN